MGDEHVGANNSSGSSRPRPDFFPCCYSFSVSSDTLNVRPRVMYQGGIDPNSSNFFSMHGNYKQLEKELLSKLDELYKEAVEKISALGYGDDVALDAVLKNGICYGGIDDVLTNILHFSLLNLSGTGIISGNFDGHISLEKQGKHFKNLRELEEYSLACLLLLLQKFRPSLSKKDAMWCLLVSDLQLAMARNIMFPLGNDDVVFVENSTETAGDVLVPALCRFHGGWGFANSRWGYANGEGSVDSLQREIDCPSRFNLSPSMKLLLKRNVAAFAAGLRTSYRKVEKHRQVEPQPQQQLQPVLQPVRQPVLQPYSSPSALAVGDQASVMRSQVVTHENNEKPHCPVNKDGKCCKWKAEKDEMIASMFRQIQELQKEEKARRDWAHQKALQAAKKLSNEMAEFKVLKIEKEHVELAKRDKQKLEDSTDNTLSELEDSLRKARGQLASANAGVECLKAQNAEIKAEMEAAKLSVSEYEAKCSEIEKREKQHLKKILAWERERTRLQEEIATEEEKIKVLKESLAELKQAVKEDEATWRQEVLAKDQASAQLSEEKRAKEAAETSNKTGLEELRLKIKIDLQHLKDDQQRLEKELSCLKLSAESSEMTRKSQVLAPRKKEKVDLRGKNIAVVLHDLELEGSSDIGAICSKVCIICMKNEISVLFLPCAHQVICASCNDTYGKNGNALCPCCGDPIEQRIRVFSAST